MLLRPLFHPFGDCSEVVIFSLLPEYLHLVNAPTEDEADTLYGWFNDFLELKRQEHNFLLNNPLTL